MSKKPIVQTEEQKEEIMKIDSSPDFEIYT